MAFGFLAVGKIKMSPQELVIGNRSFGTILLSLLFAGETITSFTFLVLPVVHTQEELPHFTYSRTSPWA